MFNMQCCHCSTSLHKLTVGSDCKN